MSEKQLELQEEEKHTATATPAVSTSTIEPSEEAPKDKTDEKPKYKREKGPAVSMLQLFRFSTPKERVLLVLAFIFSIGSGALQPVSILIYGTFINNLTGSLNDPSSLLETTLPVIHIMAYMGTASLIAAYLSNCLWVMTGESQTRRIRSLYLHSVLKQDMSWFDKAADGSLNTRLASDTQLIQDGISEKMGLLVQLVAQFIGGFVVAFVKGKVFFYRQDWDSEFNVFDVRLASSRDHVGDTASHVWYRQSHGILYHKIHRHGPAIIRSRWICGRIVFPVYPNHLFIHLAKAIFKEIRREIGRSMSVWYQAWCGIRSRFCYIYVCALLYLWSSLVVRINQG